MKNYFVYLPKQPANSIWGCVATAAGFTNILPGMHYPTRQHPLDHHFNWSDGRVLQSFQIILISAGSDKFECAAMRGIVTIFSGLCRIRFIGCQSYWRCFAPPVTLITDGTILGEHSSGTTTRRDRIRRWNILRRRCSQRAGALRSGLRPSLRTPARKQRNHEPKLS